MNSADTFKKKPFNRYLKITLEKDTFIDTRN